MRRVVNLRIMLVVAVGEIAVILFACLGGISGVLGAALSLGYLAVTAIAGIICLKKSFADIGTALVLCFFIGLFTLISFETQLALFNTAKVTDGDNCAVVGKIDTIAYDGAYVKYFTLDDVKIDGVEINGKLRVSPSDEIPFEMFTIGYEATATGKIYEIKLLDGFEIDGTSYRKDLRYKLYADSGSISADPAPLGIIDGARRALYENLRLSCGAEYGSIIYCMLTGDKSELDEHTTYTYDLAGIGHILAVSGLHVGIIVAVLMLILRKLRVNKIVRFAVVSAALIAYTLFVGMSASVVRASVMCIIAQSTTVSGERKDAMSSLCFAFTVILLFKPFLLFEVGFLLSFTAVFGWTLFHKSFNEFLRRLHFPKFLSEPIATTAAVHLSVFPVMAWSFGSVSLYSPIFNLLLVPVLSLFFTLFVFVAPISALVGGSVVLRLLGIGLAFCDLFAGITPYLPLASLNVCSSGWLFLIYPAYFVASRFFIMPRYKKIVSLLTVALCFSAVGATTFATRGVPDEIRNTVIPVGGYYDVTAVIVTDEVTVIGDLKDTYALQTVLDKFGIRKIDTVLLHGLSAEVGAKLAYFTRSYEIGRILCPLAGLQSDGLAALGDYEYFYLHEDADFDKATPVYLSNNRVAFIYKLTDSVSMLSVGYSSRYTDVPSEILDTTPIISCFMYLNYTPDRIFLTDMPKGFLGKVPEHQLSVADEGKFAFDYLGGEIIKPK